jgi:hypothetical protein
MTKLCPALCALLLTSCVTTGTSGAATTTSTRMDRAKFDSYSIDVNASEASNGLCTYGPYQLEEFSEIPKGRRTGGSHTILWEVFRELRCKWHAMDGSPREEIVRMDKLLLPKYVEWEHFEGEELYQAEPLENGPKYRIEIEGKEFKITRRFNVLLYGERLPDNAYRVKSVEVQQVIYERK